MDTTTPSLSEDSDFNLGEITLQWDGYQGGNLPPAETTKARTPPYLSGKVPLAWLAQAHALGGQCLAVGILLWFRRNLTKQAVVTLSRGQRASFQVPERSYFAAVQRLESAGLVRVERLPGHALRIMIQATPTPAT